jgi:hypothetical protein
MITRNNLVLLALLSTLLFLASAALGVVHAHDWYDATCCSNRDCYPVSETEVYPEWDAEGEHMFWVIRATGERLQDDDPRVRDTPEHAGLTRHRCSHAGQVGGRTLCIYVPGAGM